jgi:hypothetical protein
LRVANVYRGRLDLSEIHRIEVFGDELLKDEALDVSGHGSLDFLRRLWDRRTEKPFARSTVIGSSQRLMEGSA